MDSIEPDQLVVELKHCTTLWLMFYLGLFILIHIPNKAIICNLSRIDHPRFLRLLLMRKQKKS